MPTTFLEGLLSGYHQRQPVDVDHHVGSARVLTVGDSELVDGEPVVVAGIVEVQHALQTTPTLYRAPTPHRG